LDAPRDSPGFLLSSLRQNATFQGLFKDRVVSLFTDGLFAPDIQNPSIRVAGVKKLYLDWASNIELAVIAESARWGDNRRPEKPYTRDNEWRTFIEWMDDTYFQERSAIFLAQLAAIGLYDLEDEG
jgi:hypothetical protein